MSAERCVGFLRAPWVLKFVFFEDGPELKTTWDFGPCFFVLKVYHFESDSICFGDQKWISNVPRAFVIGPRVWSQYECDWSSPYP